MSYERDGIDEDEDRRELSEEERRDEVEGRFLSSFVEHLSGPSHDTWTSLKETSDAMVALGGDHFTYGISWSKEVDVRVAPLLEGDTKSWGLLLQGLGRRTIRPGEDLIRRFTDASPFRGKLVIYARKRSTHQSSYVGDTDPIIDEFLAGKVPVTLSSYDSIYVVDGPVWAAPPAQVDEDPTSVGC